MEGNKKTLKQCTSLITINNAFEQETNFKQVTFEKN